MSIEIIDAVLLVERKEETKEAPKYKKTKG